MSSAGATGNPSNLNWVAPVGQSPEALATVQPEPYIAQFRSEWLNQELQQAQAAVTLDGRRLFFVTRAGEYPADVRANVIEAQLQSVADSAMPFELEVRQTNQLPAIYLNNRLLVTVTAGDTEDNFTPQAQAEIWMRDIQQGLERAKRERQGQFIQRSLIHAIAIIIAILVLNRGLTRMWRRYRQPLQNLFRGPTPEVEPQGSISAMDLLFTLLGTLFRTVLVLGTILYIANLFPFTRQWSYRITEVLITSFTTPIITLTERSYSIIDLTIITGMLIGVVAISGMATNALRSRVLRLAGLNRGAEEAISIVTKYSLIIIGSVVLLQLWGFDITSLTIVASALGVGIGFGFQDIAKNFGSGIVLVFERRIQVGDFVEVGEYVGTVERIGGRSTTIQTLDRIFIIVPNSRFLETEVINWSHRNPVSRLHLPVGVAYTSDVRQVENALLDAAKGHPDVLLVPPPRVLFKGFGSNSLDFELLIWISEPTQQFVIKSDLYFRIFSLLHHIGVEIPYAQRDLHVRSGTLPVQLSPELEQALLKWLDRNGHGNPGEMS
ncbi:mechanosensitive ion channel family protein [Laspinema olomoucense]|uniref:Mechanosensitive ion channel n=1 Tax=Laspinema olomoucense D3b TaxID=2953688 RepID=A0ABT2N9Y6_9CYAN|nr:MULTISPECIES: mechanosensitive ion channel domain-containing protein [unclassified Laspinema]MCT7979511.1 mechanosensitive ion channel [Laspinema sp. D3b]MCT7997559.1 mechanosensitive ion channel [Laspinema sp. D3c]